MHSEIVNRKQRIIKEEEIDDESDLLSGVTSLIPQTKEDIANQYQRDQVIQQNKEKQQKRLERKQYLRYLLGYINLGIFFSYKKKFDDYLSYVDREDLLQQSNKKKLIDKAKPYFYMLCICLAISLALRYYITTIVIAPTTITLEPGECEGHGLHCITNMLAPLKHPLPDISELVNSNNNAEFIDGESVFWTTLSSDRTKKVRVSYYHINNTLYRIYTKDQLYCHNIAQYGLDANIVLLTLPNTEPQLLIDPRIMLKIPSTIFYSYVKLEEKTRVCQDAKRRGNSYILVQNNDPDNIIEKYCIPLVSSNK